MVTDIDAATDVLADRDAAPEAEDVRRQLARMIATAEPWASAKRRELLGFLVEETLAGRAATLKGFTIAIAVFDRADTFDAASDSVVRVEARRLRRDLASYYVGPGARDPVRISIPKGGYVPRFVWGEEAGPPVPGASPPVGPETEPTEGSGRAVPAASPRTMRPRGWGGRLAALAVLPLVALAVAVAILGAAGLVREPPTSAGGAVRPVEPAVVVLPFRALGSQPDSADLASGLSQELVDGILRFPGFRLYGGAPFTGEDAPVDVRALGRRLGIAYVVSGSVHIDDAGIRVLAQIADAADGEVVWSEGYDRPMEPRAIIRAQRDLAGEVAAVVGHPFGTVHKDIARRVDAGTAPAMTSYACVLSAHVHRRYLDDAALERLLSCLGEAVERDPAYSDAWAMLGWLQLDLGRLRDHEEATRRAHFARALEAARRAVALEPENTLALKALSSVLHYTGDFEESERVARRALAANPNDPDTLAQFGWRLAARGNFEEGIAAVERAIARTVDPPPWYFNLPAIHRYVAGDPEGMLPLARRSAAGGFLVGSALLAIAHGAVGDREGARSALAAVPESGPIRRDPAAFFRMHGGTDAISEALAAGLRRAESLAAGHALGSARMRCPGAPADEPADPPRDGRLSVDRAVRAGSSAQAGC